jgi:cytochrome oxidase assembly protein ShyY1
VHLRLQRSVTETRRSVATRPNESTSMTPGYRRCVLALLRQPRWIGLVAITVGLSALFWWLGSWQFDRHEARSAQNTAVQQALAQPPTPVDAVMPDPTVLAAANEHRSVLLEGTYLDDAQTLQRNPRGRSGFAVLTPLELSTGGTVVVERGFVPRSLDDPNTPEASVTPPSGPIEVTVRLRQPQASSGRVAPDGQVYDINPSDYPVSLPSPVYAAYGELEDQTPEPPAELELPPPADIGLGPHLLYAIQWWLFIPLALVGLVLLLRREAHDVDAPSPDEPPQRASQPH